MAQVAVEVPAALVQSLRETVLLLYRAALEALQLALGAPDVSLEEVVPQRERLRELDALLDQLGWPEGGGARAEPDAGPRPPEARSRRLVAEAEVLRDALHGALIDAGERLAVACAARWRGEAGADSVSAAAREVIELDRLLREQRRGG
jgi:hypothetical protein